MLAFQLLTGDLPFSDADPRTGVKSMATLISAILNDDLSARWEHMRERGVSDEAIDFVRMLLNRTVDARPSAEEALT